MTEQERLLSFALRYPRGWHDCSRTCRKAIRAMNALSDKGFLEVARYGRGINPQFRLALPETVRAILDDSR
jgi:hypothetical protein